ncbi:MAG TPA: hypothetical protein VLL97_10230, partial [Acidobacteriota bacterium]|nr:hypothetical protein [Acidobacteriota bacterium]
SLKWLDAELSDNPILYKGCYFDSETELHQHNSDPYSSELRRYLQRGQIGVSDETDEVLPAYRFNPVLAAKVDWPEGLGPDTPRDVIDKLIHEARQQGNKKRMKELMKARKFAQRPSQVGRLKGKGGGRGLGPVGAIGGAILYCLINPSRCEAPEIPPPELDDWGYCTCRMIVFCNGQPIDQWVMFEHAYLDMENCLDHEDRGNRLASGRSEEVRCEFAR